MEFRTIVQIPKPSFKIQPGERMLFVGSCFADRIGNRFREEAFPVTVNPYGVMYNPASILHTVERLVDAVDSGTADSEWFDIAVLTLGTNHVYIEKATGEIVDNCQKRPQRLFEERELTIDECADYLSEAIRLLRQVNPQIHVILTVSPIRYAKYGYHKSQLSKATLLLAIDSIYNSPFSYFPAYEIVNDELRDYRFYQPDMLHPSEQAVEYIWERLADAYFSDETRYFLQEWCPIKEALAHKPFHPESPEYQRFMQQTQQKLTALAEKYPHLKLKAVV